MPLNIDKEELYRIFDKAIDRWDSTVVRVAFRETMTEIELLLEERDSRQCCDVAPGNVACMVAPDENSQWRTPWCHLQKGHSGPHQCGELRWGNKEEVQQ